MAIWIASLLTNKFKLLNALLEVEIDSWIWVLIWFLSSACGFDFFLVFGFYICLIFELWRWVWGLSFWVCVWLGAWVWIEGWWEFWFGFGFGLGLVFLICTWYMVFWIPLYLYRYRSGLWTPITPHNIATWTASILKVPTAIFAAGGDEKQR